MDRTGTSFEIKTDTFTLENMFAMELHKYSNVIGDIVTSAVKELGIEKVTFNLSICHCDFFQARFTTQLSVLKHFLQLVCVCVHCSRE